MIQYIDKAVVIEEINRRIMDAPIDCYGHQRVWAYNDVKRIIDNLETKELPSLPSNLDEAAKDYARCYTESDNGNGGDDWEDDISIAFKAGARWLAEKGVSMSIDDNTEWEDVDTFVHRNVDGKTVIQIRQ